MSDDNLWQFRVRSASHQELAAKLLSIFDDPKTVAWLREAAKERETNAPAH